jgi:hypothetical protein
MAGNAYVQNQRADSLSDQTRAILANQQRKQDKLDQERQKTLGEALNEAAVGRNEVEAAQRKQTEKAVSRMEANSKRPDPKENNPDKAGMDGPAGRVISSAVSREADANNAESTGRRRAMAEMDSLGDVLTGNNRIFRPAYGEIQANQRIAQGEADRMQLELQAAKEKAMSEKRALEIAANVSQGVGSGLLASGAWGATAGAGGGVTGGTGTAVTSASGPTSAKISRLPQLLY